MSLNQLILLPLIDDLGLLYLMFLLSYPIFSFMFITLFIYSPFINVSTWPKRTFWSFITKPRFLIVYREQKICFQTFPISKNIWWSQTQLWLRRNTGRGYSISHDLPRLGSVMDQSSVASAEIMHLQNSPRAQLQPPSIFLNMDNGELGKQFNFLVISIWGWLS